MKKVLILALVLVLLLGIAARGIFGLFSDTENSTGNTFTAWVEVCSYATEDSWVQSDKPEENYGSDDTLHTRVQDSGGKLRRAYLKFNIPSCPPPQGVTSAKLKVYAKKADKPGEIGIYTVSPSWSEDTITWNNAPTDFTFITSEYVDSAGWWEFDITDAVTGGSTLSLVMKFTDETICEQHVDWYSREEGSGAYWPLVCVECK